MELPCFDIEAVGWVNPIAVGFYDGFNYLEFIRESEDDDVIWRFLCYLRDNCKGIKLYAHCASKYDNKFILASLCQHEETVVPEAGLIRLRWKEPNICFEDSYMVVPMSLQSMNKGFGVEEKGEWPHEKQLKPWEMGEQLGTFREYLKTDCLSLSHSMSRLCEELGINFGITPSISLSTTSAKAFSKCFYDVEDIESNEEFEEFIRAGIYGQRNEVYKRYGENIYLYDVKSMFVSCYDVPVPMGKMYWMKPNLDEGTLIEAKVKVPKDLYVGPLPLKYKGGLIFPVGELPLSWWDARELRNATEFGCDVSIRRQLVCEEKPILEDFGKLALRLRDKSKNWELREFWKMFGLSLSGKFGQRRWRDTIKYVDEIKDFTGYTPLDEDELYYEIKEYISGRTPYIKPAIAMRIRAEARIRHLRQLLGAQKVGSIFYCDTDSIFTTAKLPATERAGELSYLGKASRGYFIRQKLYAIIQKGRMRQKSAGYSDLKLSEEDFIKLLNGEDLKLIEDVLPPYKGILRDKELELLERPRMIKSHRGDTRIPVGFDTEPISLPDS